MSVDYFSIIHKYIPPESEMYKVYLPHVVLVTNKALEIARRLELSEADQQFIQEAGMLHDIGLCMVKNESKGAHGKLPYICHGTEGRRILEDEGLPEHALIAERHTGVGIRLAEIEDRNLPLPHRNMEPETQVQRLISYADLFFSKRVETLWEVESIESVEEELRQFGEDRVELFREWHREFGEA